MPSHIIKRTNCELVFASEPNLVAEAAFAATKARHWSHISNSIDEYLISYIEDWLSENPNVAPDKRREIYETIRDEVYSDVNRGLTIICLYPDVTLLYQAGRRYLDDRFAAALARCMADHLGLSVQAVRGRKKQGVAWANACIQAILTRPAKKLN